MYIFHLVKGQEDFNSRSKMAHLALNRVPTAQGKQGKWPEKKSLSGKKQGIWKFCQNTGNLVYSSCKFPDSKVKDISKFAVKISKNFET